MKLGVSCCWAVHHCNWRVQPGSHPIKTCLVHERLFVSYLHSPSIRALPCRSKEVQIELNVSVLQTFYEVEGRYVYAVTDLTPTSLPCGEPSRWKLLDCSGGCSGSAMDAADALSISTALQAGQGVVRDIAISTLA